MRSVVFGVLVLVLMVVALSFVVSTLSPVPGNEHVVITASVTYTVKLMEVPPEQRETAQALLRQPQLRSLAGQNDLFLCDLPDGKVALCAGRFPSSDVPEAQALLSRFKNHTLMGERSFASAQIWSYTPERP